MLSPVSVGGEAQCMVWTQTVPAAFHTDGTDAVSSMQVIVSPAGAYLTWLGQAVNMLKSKHPIPPAFSEC